MPRVLVLLLLTAVLAGCSVFSSDEGGPTTGDASAGPSPSASPSEATSSAPAEPTYSLGPIEATFFGVHDHEPVVAGPTGWPDAPVGSLRAWDAGVTWRQIELTAGTYDFSRLDALVANAELHDSDVLLVLGQTPVFHAKDPSVLGFYGEGASSPPDVEAWTAYVRAVAERYAGRPVVLQVWNEANVAGFWSGTPQEMAELTKAAYDVVAEVSPRPTLVSPALVTRLIGQRAWIDDFYATSVDGAPVADFMDVVSLQLYPEADGTPESSMELLAALRVVLDRNGVDKPIWNTEVNYGLTGLEVPAAPMDRQVMNVVATYLLNAANGVERVYWYGWDQQLIVDTLLVEADTATLTRAGRAFTDVRGWMLGGTVSSTSCEPDDDGTYACTIEHPDGVRTVYWNPGKTVTVTLPEGTASTHKAGRSKQPAAPGDALTVGKVPVMVTG